MNESPSKSQNLYDRLAVSSLICGCLGLLTCCCMNPPFQMILGGASVVLALASRGNGSPFSTPAKIGLGLGIVSAALSILVFGQFMWAMDLVKDPENAALVREIYDQFSAIMESAASGQMP